MCCQLTWPRRIRATETYQSQKKNLRTQILTLEGSLTDKKPAPSVPEPSPGTGDDQPTPRALPVTDEDTSSSELVSAAELLSDAEDETFAHELSSEVDRLKA